jgi:hypothetical protein
LIFEGVKKMKVRIYLGVFILLTAALLALMPNNSFAQEAKSDPEMEARVQLIKASQQLEEEQEKKAASAVSLYLTTYHSGEKELNLGAKYEGKLFKNRNQSVVSVDYVIEGIYLEGEDTNLAGFLSLKASLKDKLFAPYAGAGAEFMGKADYQAFVGLNLTDNFFVETKFINDKDELDSGDFYSTVGFKINF